MEITKSDNHCMCIECYAQNYDSTGTSPMLGKRVDSIYVLRSGGMSIKLCPSCLKQLAGHVNAALEEEAQQLPGRPYKVGDEVWAIVKHPGTFQLEVRKVKVAKESVSGGLVVECKESLFMVRRWTFPEEAWMKEVFPTEGEAQVGLYNMCHSEG